MSYVPVSFIEGNTATINATAIVDGQVLFDTEAQKLYMDKDGLRKSYGGGSDEAQVISYTDFMNLTPAQREEGKYLVTGMTPMTNAYNLDYKDGKTVGQELDTVNQHLTELENLKFTTYTLDATFTGGDESNDIYIADLIGISPSLTSISQIKAVIVNNDNHSRGGVYGINLKPNSFTIKNQTALTSVDIPFRGVIIYS